MALAPIIIALAATLAVREAVLHEADRLLDEAGVSYVYGGGQLGDPKTCEACNACLEKKHPAAAKRFSACPTCRHCSLDCSHFTALVFEDAGFPYPYLDTATMQAASADKLRRAYHLIDLGTDLTRAAPGDLLVYNGHVVLLERIDARLHGDVVHSTSGRAIRGPGEGIQRERFIDLATFRGHLQRILRHEALGAPEPLPVTAKPHLRPVIKQSPPD